MLWGDGVSVKYRIEYEMFPLYQKRSGYKKLNFGLLIVLLVSLVMLIRFNPLAANAVQELLVPGDFDVTTNALQQLSEALDNGDSFVEAVDAFCDAIMDVRS